MEGYHVLETHTDGLPIYASVATRIDNWSDGLGLVSRLFTPAVAPDSLGRGSRHGARVPDHVLHCHEAALPPEDRGNDLGDARRYAAEMLRKRVESSSGRDFSQHPSSYFIDQGRYTMFPNFSSVLGRGVPAMAQVHPRWVAIPMRVRWRSGHSCRSRRPENFR